MSETPWYLKSYEQQFKAKPENRLLNKIEAVLVEELANDSYVASGNIRPSEMAANDWCPRQTYYRLTNETESDAEQFSMRRENIFEEGHYIHAKWQNWMWKAGVLVGVFRCTRCHYGWMGKSPRECPQCGSAQKHLEYREVPLYSEEYRIKARADGEIEDDQGRALVELKSVGLGTIRWDAPMLYAAYEKGEVDLDGLWKRIKRPLTAHRKQINLYLWLRKLNEAIVIYEWKPTQAVKEFHLQYEDDLVQPMLVGAKDVINALADEIPPKRPDKATSKSCNMCKYCPYKTTCWKAKT